ncbi:urease accessory protein UreH domain-containing protein [Desulfogranum marinum]|uniref:urease accessory protein UreH domain-containing protein n=1 Tax=Desulfogranum marinum TaxID=453220 RepID=UPI001966A3E8|nr:sulfite exporter TauE/SafE family protein [Desulfogranum marinum]MBM9511879.1 sulfite exporter TauE/SafE family protein [Desulfogranum marinum]
MPAIEKGKRGTNNTIIDIFGPELPLPAIAGRAIYRESKGKKHFAGGLFVVGFVNMIVPCPTAAVMYGYAINSGSMVTAIAVFGVYAISIVFAVGGGIYLLYTASKMITSLDHHRLGPMIMRLSGVVIVVFSDYGVFHSIYL